jgi:hypothetical protein
LRNRQSQRKQRESEVTADEPPAVIKNLVWFRQHGRQHWRLVAVAAVALAVIIFVLYYGPR